MLRLTKKADYGLIALKHMAVFERSGSLSAKDIADAYGIPLAMLSKILQRMAKGGLVQSEQGTNGGYRLARRPALITALDVVQAVDGPVVLTGCFDDDESCVHRARCNVREPLRRVHEGILGVLQGITIADMAERELRQDALVEVGGSLPAAV